MTIIATVGVYAGLALLVLMALTPALLELDQRFPVGRRVAVPRPAKAKARQGATLASA